ncbi:hypothetical protein EV383_5237 [Pseudonocardia sediminis]|uniref:Uncharacterized protein n=1 Tax=Pseudonocardia sediminis TaxID=1397368 RepID=A0A4Q7V3V6_PSEST|nr:DUF6350 family protein [Pseudonocardia sediminis]RZT88298.1 hypothetical protein EV383_5237 [Pseudonocardia sediminis]
MSTTAPIPTERSTGGAARARPQRRPGRGARDRKGTPGSGRQRRDGLERLRVLLAGTMGAILAGYTMMVPLAAVLTASGGEGVSPDGALATAVPLWLAAQQIPLVLDGRQLGVLPLLPTIAVFTVVTIASGWSVRRLGGRVRHDAGAVVASQAGAAAVVAVLGGALLPQDMAVTAPWASMVGAGLVAGSAAGVGVLRACGLPETWRERLQGWPAAGLAGARAGAAGLVLSGALVLLAGLLGHAPEVARSFATLAPGAGAGLGVALLAVAYLPNALLGGMAWALGPGVDVGAARNGPFGAVDGAMPPFPLFAAFPTAPVSVGAVLVLLLPLGAGVAAGVVCSRSLGPVADRTDRLAAAGVAAAVTAAGAGLGAAIAGGRLADGPYDPVTLSGWLVFLAALLLVGLPAVAVCMGLDRSATGAGRARGVAEARRTARADAGRPGSPRAGTGRSAAARAAAARAAGRAASAEHSDEPVARRPGTRRPAGDDEGRDGGEDGGDDRRAGSRTPSGRGTASRDARARTADGPSRRSGPATPEAEHDEPPRTVADLVARRERESAAPHPDED